MISIFEALDFESCKDFYLVVEAKDGGTPALSAVTTVNVNVTDVNDNAPTFSQPVYSAVISEDAAIGDSVVMVSRAMGAIQVPCTPLPLKKNAALINNGNYYVVKPQNHFLDDTL